jgi:hypothetical protein
MHKRIIDFIDWVGRVQTVSAVLDLIAPLGWKLAVLISVGTGAGTMALNLGNTLVVAFLAGVGTFVLFVGCVVCVAAMRGKFAGQLIDMDRAIQTAIDKTHDTASFENSKRVQDPITYYANAIWCNDVKLFGCRPPARTQVEVPISKRGQLRFFKHAGKMALSYIAEDKPEYVDLKVGKVDLAKRISELIALDDVFK